MKLRRPVLAAVVALAALPVVAAGPPHLEAEAAQLGIPFHRYTTTDTLGRTITLYLSAPPANGTRLPVVLFIQGSGCQSLFRKVGDRIGGGYHTLLAQEAQGKARVLAVEKPGVNYLDAPARPGSTQGASETFLREHTLPRWAEANAAALRAAWALPDVDATRTLAVGHSEGGIVAARVAAEVPQVTHVATLAGGGPTQLFDFVTNAARARPGDQPGDAEKRAQAVYDAWTQIRQDPESITQFWLGHPYRRWSSFLGHSVTGELLRGQARVYAAAGVQDAVIPVAAHDALVAELRAHGRDVTAERLEGADHGFRTEAMPQGSPEGMRAGGGRVLRWFLGGDAG
jgi:dienelactone hydrolase